jgi:NADPH-dependent F420 reductase
MSDNKKTIAVLGGTGKEGGGLALRWAHAGHPVIIGSRTAERAEQAAAELRALLGESANLRGLANLDAAQAAEIVVLSVPFAAQQSTVREVAAALAGKILIDVTVPLVPPKVSRVQLPEGGSAVEAVQQLLGEGVQVVSAFQNISAQHLTKLDEAVECDVLVCANDPAAAEEVVALAEEIGLTAWNAGPLCNSVVSEALTSVLIALNRRYKVPGSGIRITGVPRAEAL